MLNKLQPAGGICAGDDSGESACRVGRALMGCSALPMGLDSFFFVRVLGGPVAAGAGAGAGAGTSRGRSLAQSC